jgi:transposase-like protein
MNMAKRRKWESSQKLKIVLEGLSGQIEISKLCNKYQISQVIYYRFREQLLPSPRLVIPVTSGVRI